jgi:hypothetical protein
MARPLHALASPHGDDADKINRRQARALRTTIPEVSHSECGENLMTTGSYHGRPQPQQLSVDATASRGHLPKLAPSLSGRKGRARRWRKGRSMGAAGAGRPMHCLDSVTSPETSQALFVIRASVCNLWVVSGLCPGYAKGTHSGLGCGVMFRLDPS